MHIFLENQTNNIYTNYIFRFASPAQHGSSWSAILSNYPAQLVVFKLVSSQNSYGTCIFELVSSQNLLPNRVGQPSVWSARQKLIAQLVFASWSAPKIVLPNSSWSALDLVSSPNCSAQLVFASWSAPKMVLPNSCFGVGQSASKIVLPNSCFRVGQPSI